MPSNKQLLESACSLLVCNILFCLLYLYFILYAFFPQWIMDYICSILYASFFFFGPFEDGEGLRMIAKGDSA